MNIHILYRHYNIEGKHGSKRPSWFDFETCFKNLLNTIKDKQHIKLYIIADNVDKSNFIYKYLNEYEFEIIDFSGGSDFDSFVYTTRFAHSLNIDMDDIIYFLENDYLHASNWDMILLDLFEKMTDCYVSLYDHNDKYFWEMYENLRSKIFVTKSAHWRVVPSTTGTFAITKKLLLEDFDILSTMQGDYHKFLYLTETRNRLVLTSIPGYSTHCINGLLSPTIDWEKISKNK